MATSNKMKALLEKRRADLKKRSENTGFDYFVFKEGTTRIRVLPGLPEREPGFEITHFYLGQEIKGVISPSTFGRPCAIMEAFEALSAGDDDEKKLAATIKPKKKWLIPIIRYKDEQGKEIDEREKGKGAKPALISNKQYQDIIDFFLDEEQGDFTDAAEGYDIKVKRTGKTMTDTEYTVIPCKPTKLSITYAKKAPYDIEKMVEAICPSYEDTQELANRFLGIDPDAAPKKKFKKKVGEAPAKPVFKKKLKKKVRDDE